MRGVKTILQANGYHTPNEHQMIITVIMGMMVGGKVYEGCFVTTSSLWSALMLRPYASRSSSPRRGLWLGMVITEAHVVNEVHLLNEAQVMPLP